MSKRKDNSTQKLIGIETFSKYGLITNSGELIFFSVTPTNISVLSKTGVSNKVRHLMMVLSAIPEIEITCIDSCECFDKNKHYMLKRISEETNPKVIDMLKKDLHFLDEIQVEMATARQFMFVVRIKSGTEEQAFSNINRVEKTLSEQSFEVKRLSKEDIKHFISIYFNASMLGEKMADADGENHIKDLLKGEIDNGSKKKKEAHR